MSNFISQNSKTEQKNVFLPLFFVTRKLDLWPKLVKFEQFLDPIPHFSMSSQPCILLKTKRYLFSETFNDLCENLEEWQVFGINFSLKKKGKLWAKVWDKAQ